MRCSECFAVKSMEGAGPIGSAAPKGIVIIPALGFPAPLFGVDHLMGHYRQ